MACYYPVGVYRTDGSPAYRPCGKCIGCKLEHARQWAVRCVNEAQLHEENSFITLTYNDENLPEDRSVDKKELSKFIRRLRKKIDPIKIRFYGCGEYGEKFDRPHYHACIFGYSFPDRQIHHAGRKRWFRGRFKSGPNHDLYTSQQLEGIWKKGFSTVGDLTFESAGYTARYVAKKITGDKAPGHYKGKTPEFALMSRRPGIGRPWLDKYLSDVYPKDYHTIRGIKQRPCRYYDAQLKSRDPYTYEKIKEKRRAQQERLPYESHMRKAQKEFYYKNITKSLERKIK